MKLTQKKLIEMIEKEVEAAEEQSYERPWYHGPFKSDFDKEMEELCDEGDEQACAAIEERPEGATDEEFRKIKVRLTGKA